MRSDINLGKKKTKPIDGLVRTKKGQNHIVGFVRTKKGQNQ
jgi:hypothetical protein